MSGIVVGLVIELPISEKFTSEMKFTAVIYADHAWQDGTHAHPAIATVAHKTGYHERSVQRYVRALENIGVLVIDGKGPHGTNNYKFPLVMTDGAARLALKVKGDTLPPRQLDTGDTDSGDTDSGDTGVTRINQPRTVLVVVNAGFAEISKSYESEFGGLTPMIADAIGDALDTYSAEWVLDAMQIAVTANKRNWKYVEGILKNCKAKNIRPALNKLESRYGDNGTGNKQRTRKSESAPAVTPDYTPADIQAAERVRNKRRERVSAM